MMKQIIEQQRKREEKQYELTGSRCVLMDKDTISLIRLAETVVSCAVHPDTQELIPWPFRFSSSILAQLPLSYGLVVASPTPFNTILWQWINQTFFAATNYENRNATSEYTTKDIAYSYTVATVAAIGSALMIRRALRGYTEGAGGPMGYVLNSVSSFWALSISGFLNAWIMRRTEM